MSKEVTQWPKVNVSAYIHFLQHFRNKFKEQQPNAYICFVDFSRQCSAKWRSISKYEKAKYEALARLDRARYKKEMMNFRGKRRKRRKRDPNAPRKPPSSFLLFAKDHYGQLKEENPDWTVVEVAKAAGKMWTRMEEVHKAPYEKAAALMRAKYFKQREAYLKQCQGKKKNFRGLTKSSSK